MASRAIAIRRIGFLTPGNYPDHDPASGLEATLKLFEAGEALGYDSAWVRQRHLEHGISSAAVFLAAASQRTRRIELGSAVIQMGYESPFRLAEDDPPSRLSSSRCASVRSADDILITIIPWISRDL
jgi:hypothetical protein